MTTHSPTTDKTQTQAFAAVYRLLLERGRKRLAAQKNKKTAAANGRQTEVLPNEPRKPNSL